MKMARRISPKVTLFFGLGTSIGSCARAMLDVENGVQCSTRVVRFASVYYEVSR